MMMKFNLPKPKLRLRIKPRWVGYRWRHDISPSRFKTILTRHFRHTPAVAMSGAVLIVFSIGLDIFNAWNFASSYELTPQAQAVLPRASAVHAAYLKQDKATGRIDYNAGYTPQVSENGQSSRPRFLASFELEPKNGTTVTDPVNSTSVTFKPKFNMLPPQIQSSRLVYPLRGRDGAKVVTVGTSGFKEDIILNKEQGDKATFEYEMVLPDGVEARLEADGSIGFYGVDATLLGNVSTGSEADEQLLQKARQNGDKTKLLFVVPAPIVLESNRQISSATASFALENNRLIINAADLKSANYPLSIDPSIYVETAAKLMRGNNETNIDFDVDSELIQKSQTTGARIDAWEGNLDMSEGIWDHATAAAGGYVYRTGGRTGASKPQLLSEQTTNETTNDNSFQMAMPAERPAGDLYIALMCHDNAALTVTEASGWTELADTGEFAAYYKIGTDQGGGNEAANYTFNLSGTGAKSGTIVRVSGFNASDPISGLPGTDNSGSNEIPEFPATTPDNSATLVIRAVGADADPPSATGWVPAGHTKIASSTSGGGAPCGFVAASLDNPPAASSPAAAISLADNSINDTWGGMSVAINPASSPPPPIIASQQSSQQSSNSNSFAMAMPSTRPAGDLYIAMMCHDGNVNVTPPAGGGWDEYADTGLNEYAAYWKVGTDVSGGNEAASYTWTITGGTSEIWAGVIIRITGFDSSDPVSGTPGTGNGGSGAPTFPATTPDNNSTLIVRGAGFDEDPPHATNWIPAGHTKIDSGAPGTTNDCGYTAAFMNNSPASGITTGSAAFGGGSGVDDSWGASTIAINPDPSAGGFTEDVRTTVNWAKFNSSTLAIESPNPGEGVCTDWCGNSVYDLPEPRRGHSMVAYNGYLYVLGGVDDDGDRVSTVLIAKLGANGEPSLWHPTDTDKANWDYWYSDSGLSSGTARSYLSAAVYNNRLYISGGQTNASAGGTTTMQYAEIRPNGTLGSWSNGETLPGAGGRHGHTTHIYNDVLYLIGGNINGTLQNTVHYSRLNDDGSMNEWVQTSSFSTARSTMGGNFTAVWGAYIYLAGGCTAVNGSGYCTSIASDTQLASINADGSLAPWGLMGGLENTRIGHTLLSWQGGLYRLGGCTSQDGTGGYCVSTLADVDYGVVNPAGEVSTVNISTQSGSGSCTGGSPINCDLPPPGDAAGQGGNMLSMTTLLNGYLYVIGGCTDYNCDGSTPGAADISGNTAYVSVDSNGNLSAPSSCAGSSYGAWCVESTNQINGATGIAAGGITTFNGRIYVVGGIDNTSDGSTEIYYTTPDSVNGRPGAWSSTSFGTAGISGEMAYTYAYARANPSAASTNPGNLFTFGGCGDVGTGPGCSSSNYRSHVYKCNIAAEGSINGCSTSGQLQIDAELEDETDEGLGIHSGTVYANYIYLIGGFSAAVGDRDTVYYARFNDSNNIVSVTTGAAGGNNDDWILSGNTLSVGRRRGWAFGYNGHIYAVGGYDDTGTGIIPFIEWAKIDVSDGSIEEFVTSSVTINQRWGLSMAVSNSYAYVIGGCNTGASPGSCSSFERAVQTFQLYNNDSGAPVSYAAGANLFSTDRLGASSAVHNGYLYVAGGCTSVTDCTDATNNVQYASLDEYGNIGTWSSTTASLPADRAWGQLEAAGGSLYYVGGQGNSATDERAEVYYATPNTTATITSEGLTSGTSTGTSVNTASVSVAAGDLIVVAVGNYNSACGVASAGLSGLGITWSNENIAFGGNCERVTYFWGVAPSSTSGALTISFSGQSQEDVGWAVSKVRGQRTTTPVAQDLDNSNTATSSIDVTMASPVDGDSIFITGSYFIPDAETGEPGYTTQYDFDTTFGAHLHVQYGDVDITLSPGVTGIDDTPGNAAGIVGLEIAAADPASAGDVTSWNVAGNGLPEARSQHGATVWNNRIYVTGGNNTSGAAQNTVYISPDLSAGGDISSAWTSDGDVFEVARNGHTTLAYANNLYVLGGHDGTNYLSDVQFARINPADGTIGEWTFTTSLPTPIRQADGFAANGYMYLVGGRSSHIACASNTLVTPISANTTIASGNNPTGIGEWYETNQRYSSDRYGAAVSYSQGKIYVLGGGCPADPSNPAASVLEDNFDATLDAGDWTSTTGMSVGTTCGSVSGNNLRGTTGTAAATTINVDVRYGGTVSFDMRIPTSNAGGCNQPEADEDVQLQYSINNGTTWTTMVTYDETTCCNAWTGFDVDIPFVAQTANTRFRWQIINAETDDHWALDDVEIFANQAPDNTEIWEDNFDPSIDGGDWTSTSNTNVGTNCGTITSGNSLVSTGGPNAVAETIDLDVTYGGTVTFDLRIPTSNTGTCNAPEAGEDLNLQYSTNGGGNWTTIVTYDESDYNAVTRLSTIIPAAAHTPSTRFRWNMPGADGADDEWAIDQASISATILEPTYTAANRVVQTALLSQPQVAKYSRLIDTDTDVFPNAWLMNGIDNSIGASWQVRYRSMNDTDGVPTDCGSADMSTWGQETNFGDVTLGNVEPYVPRDGSGNDIDCARYFYFFISIDASQTFGYPEDVERGPTIADITLFFTSDPSKRLRHGKTFTGGEKQPLDTPCRVSGGGAEHANCPLP